MKSSPAHALLSSTSLGLGRRTFARALAAALGMSFLGEPDARGEGSTPFYVIVNQGNSVSSVPRDFVEDAFLKKRSRWNDDEPIRPADQSASSPVRRSFSESVLKRSVAAIRNYWQQRIFSGRDTPPPELESDDAVVAYVSKYRGGIGYVSTSAKLTNVKAISVG